MSLHTLSLPGRDVSHPLTFRSTSSVSSSFSTGIPISKGLPGKHSNGLHLNGAGFRLQSRFSVARSRSDSPPELVSKENDDKNEGLDIFRDFEMLTTGRSGDKRFDDEEVKGEKTLSDWSSKARERAIRAVQERELPVRTLVEDGKKRKKKKKKKKEQLASDDGLTKGKWEIFGVPDDEDKDFLTTAADVQVHTDSPMSGRLGRSGEGLKGLAALANYPKNESKIFASENHTEDDVKPQRNDDIVPRPFSNSTPTNYLENVSRSGAGSQRSETSNRLQRQEDFDLNRRLIGASDAFEVLSLVGDVLEDKVWGPDEIPLSHFNAATALHRIAKHMERVLMHRSDRLSFARKKVMAQLVSAAIESLPKGSARSISNIAWALSKVGGCVLYGPEMDLLAQVAMTRISDLEPQHIANIAGAMASMQHSVPPLFVALDHRASVCCRNFQSQELAQLLWAYATLNYPAESLLNSLDSDCKTNLDGFHNRLGKSVPIAGDGGNVPPNLVSDNVLADVDPKANEGDIEGMEVEVETCIQPRTWIYPNKYIELFGFSELASLSWSYTVLGQLRRPFFALVWEAILLKGIATSSDLQDLPSPSLQLSQLYQTKISLELEYPDLGLSMSTELEELAGTEWENVKRSMKSTSVTQLDVERLLVGMGQKWVSEYRAAEYSLDAALAEEKIALEIDGPSHFTRNTGMPLGHTILKQRQLAAAGWTTLSIPYREWDDLLGEEEQRNYLYNLLKGHL